MELAREQFESQRNKELKKRAEAFIQLRDIMNTPLQVILLSLESLDSKDPSVTHALRSAVDTLTRLNRLLSQHEQHLTWGTIDKFFDEQDIEDILRPPSQKTS